MDKSTNIPNQKNNTVYSRKDILNFLGRFINFKANTTSKYEFDNRSLEHEIKPYYTREEIDLIFKKTDEVLETSRKLISQEIQPTPEGSNLEVYPSPIDDASLKQIDEIIRGVYPTEA